MTLYSLSHLIVSVHSHNIISPISQFQRKWKHREVTHLTSGWTEIETQCLWPLCFTFNPLTIKRLNYELCFLVIISVWQMTEVRPVKGLVPGPSWHGKKPRLGVPSLSPECFSSLSCKLSICKRPGVRKRKKWGSWVETHQRDLNTKKTVEGYQMADPPTTRLFWAVATLTLAWVVGLILETV